MSTWECWLFRSIWFNMYVQKHVQVIYVMHTCEMFFHALVCMHWACFGSITLAFSLVCAPAMHMCCKLVPIHLCVSLTCVVTVYLSGVYLCQLTSAKIVDFIFRWCVFVGQDVYGGASTNMLWVTCDLFTCCYLGGFIYYIRHPQTWTCLHETYLRIVVCEVL